MMDCCDSVSHTISVGAYASIFGQPCCSDEFRADRMLRLCRSLWVSTLCVGATHGVSDETAVCELHKTGGVFVTASYAEPEIAREHDVAWS